eukprot:scaffold81681_cov60-Phaeocystis_antarctica.AAC.4
MQTVEVGALRLVVEAVQERRVESDLEAAQLARARLHLGSGSGSGSGSGFGFGFGFGLGSERACTRAAPPSSVADACNK